MLGVITQKIVLEEAWSRPDWEVGRVGRVTFPSEWMSGLGKNDEIFGNRARREGPDFERALLELGDPARSKFLFSADPCSRADQAGRERVRNAERYPIVYNS